MKKYIIGMVEMVHLLIAIFLMVGGYILPKKYIPIFLLCTPYLVIDWNDTDGSCWLTKLRNMIQYGSLDPEVDDEMENEFLNNIMRKNNIIIKTKTFTFLLYLIIYASWLYAYSRLIHQYKIKIFINKYIQYGAIFMITGWILVTIPSLKKF